MSFSTKIKDAREIAQKPRVEQGGNSWYSTYFVNYFSIYISYPLAKLGVPANFVTVLMGVAGLCGSLCMVPHNLRWNLVGAVLWQLWFILDCVDGEVARLRNKTSLLGVYLDEVNHIIVNSTFVLALGLHVYFLEPSILNLIASIAIYSTWHWKREIMRLMSATLVVKAGVSKDAFVTKRKKSTILIRRILFSFSGELESMLFLTAIIIISHRAGVDFAKWILYVYTLVLLAFVSAAILIHARKIYKKENSE